jgi:hypothetical protein
MPHFVVPCGQKRTVGRINVPPDTHAYLTEQCDSKLVPGQRFVSVRAELVVRDLIQCGVSGGSEFSDPSRVDFHAFRVCAS